MQTSVILVNIRATLQTCLSLFEAKDYLKLKTVPFNTQMYHLGVLVLMLTGLRPFLCASLQSCWNGR